MKKSSSLVAVAFASLVASLAVPALAASPHGAPQCGDEKKGEKDEKKPTSPSVLSSATDTPQCGDEKKGEKDEKKPTSPSES